MRTHLLLLAILLPSLVSCGDDDPVTPGGTRYELKHESICAGFCASGFFGGDNRAVGGPRNVGVGCSVLIDADVFLDSFAFFFEPRFDYVEGATMTGHAATLLLHIRDASGVILKTVQVDVPESHFRDWVTWTGINLQVDANTTLIFTTNLVGAYDTNELTTGQRSDPDALYTDGVRYTKEGTDDASMEEWTGWSVHGWDAWFWLRGRHRQ